MAVRSARKASSTLLGKLEADTTCNRTSIYEHRSNLSLFGLCVVMQFDSKLSLPCNPMAAFFGVAVRWRVVGRLW